MKALAALLRRLSTLVGQAWAILGLTLLLLLATDQLLRALLPDSGQLAALDPAAIAPGRARADAVAGDSWIDDYWKDHEASRYTDWVSYVYWRRRPYAGTIIRVDANGFRVTPHAQAQHLRTLWLFGGSTAWGTGNRDGGTLAAQLEQVYAERAAELGVRVVNFGESGYVARQSLAAFQSALGCAQPAADMAIFLDGANDVFAALQSGAAGLPQNEENRRREFNSSRQLGAQLRAWALRLEGIARLIAPTPAARTADAERDLAAAVADAYLGQSRQAKALAAAYDVDLLYVWQPTAFDRAPARADEAAIVAASMAEHVRLQRQTRAAVQARLAGDASTTVVDLGGVFDAQQGALFFDFVHLSERGQRLLAERLYELSSERLRARPQRQPSPDVCRDRPVDAAG